MTSHPYDYSTRKGILPISWQDFHGLCKALAKAVASFQPDILLPIGRGGYYPGALIAHLLRVEVYPVRISRRVNDRVRYDTPQWLAEPPALVRDKRVLVVDEICGSGETLSIVRSKAVSLGASEVRSAVLYAHTWGVSVPDYIGLISDALLLNPWDREVLVDGEFRFHPEYVDALRQQGMVPEPAMRIDATPFELAKSGPTQK